MSIYENRRKSASGGVLAARLVFTAAAVTSLYLLATVHLEWKQQGLLGVTLFCLATLLNRASKSPVVTILISVLAMFSTVRYAYFRYSETFGYLNFNWAETQAVDLFFVFVLLAAETYAFAILFLGAFQTMRPLKRPSAPLPDDPALWPTVDIYIPTYNEPPYL